MRILYIFLIFCSQLVYANVDATLEVVKKFGRLPNILVQIVGTDYYQKEYGLKIFKMLVADLKVTGHFSVEEEKQIVSSGIVVNFDEYRSKKIDLIAKIYTETFKNGGLKVNLQLYDINSENPAFNKEYSTTKFDAYPFLAHKIAVDINEYTQAPDVSWLERMVVLYCQILMHQQELDKKKRILV